jgi:hypothetical protein
MKPIMSIETNVKSSRRSFMWIQPFKTEALLMFVAGQYNGIVDSFLRDKSLKQRSGKLNGLTPLTTNDRMANRPPVVVQVGFW